MIVVAVTGLRPTSRWWDHGKILSTYRIDININISGNRNGGLAISRPPFPCLIGSPNVPVYELPRLSSRRAISSARFERFQADSEGALTLSVEHLELLKRSIHAVLS